MQHNKLKTILLLALTILAWFFASLAARTAQADERTFGMCKIEYHIRHKTYKYVTFLLVVKEDKKHVTAVFSRHPQPKQKEFVFLRKNCRIFKTKGD